MARPERADYPPKDSSVRPPNVAAGEPVPWLYEHSNVPVDKAWTFGTLPNGLRYAVRHNTVPPGQVSIRVRIDAGSLMEQDDEQGFAHLLEHLTFRGSKYVPDGEAIRTWQRLGATFGSDSNAETTPTQTVYKLDLPNADPASLDESIKIISGMIREPGLISTAITGEVPVVLAEQRERSGAQMRISEETRKLFFAGQRLAERAPIGTAATLNAATQDSVRAFHRKWYRPENTVISISGDADPAKVAALLKTYFGDWKLGGQGAVQPKFGDPDPSQPVSEVLVEPSFPYLLSMAIVRPWRPVQDTIAYNRGLLIDQLALQIINRRLEGRARGGGNYLQASVNQDDVSRSVDGTFVSIIPLGDDWQKALVDVRGVIADAMTTPPTREEIDRELAEFEAALTVQVESAQTEASAKQADDIVGAVDIRESVASPEVAREVFLGMRSDYTPERLLEATRKLFEGDARRVLLVAPKPVPNGEAELATLASEQVAADGTARLAARQVTVADLPDLGPPGTVESTTDLKLLGMEMITLSNGVKALLYPNDAEVSKIMVKVRFGNGMEAFPPDKPSLIWSGEAALVNSGLGDLGQEELDRLTTGRRIGFNFDVENDAFSFSANTRAADLEDQLRLFATKLAYPRWDDAPVLRAKAAAKLAYQSYSVSPQAVLDRDLQYLVHNRDPRWKTPDPQEIDTLTPEAFRATWEPLLKQGPVEVMLFGDFDRDEAVAALERTFGAIAPRSPAPIVSGSNKIQFPAPNDQPVVLYHTGSADQAAAFIGWPTGGGLDAIRESRQLEILTSIFNNRLFDQLRGQEGASYAPQVINSWPVAFDSGGHIGVVSQLAPDSIDRFYSVVDSIVADLKAKPVSEDELVRVTEPLRQLISRASTGNGFWLSQLQGATTNRARIAALRTILGDYSQSSPEQIQALANRYLDQDKAWKLVVVPEPKPKP